MSSGFKWQEMLTSAVTCTHTQNTHVWLHIYQYMHTCTSYTLGCPRPWSWYLLHVWCDWPKTPHGESDYMLVQAFLSLPYINGFFFLNKETSPWFLYWMAVFTQRPHFLTPSPNLCRDNVFYEFGRDHLNCGTWQRYIANFNRTRYWR